MEQVTGQRTVRLRCSRRRGNRWGTLAGACPALPACQQGEQNSAAVRSIHGAVRCSARLTMGIHFSQPRNAWHKPLCRSLTRCRITGRAYIWASLSFAVTPATLSLWRVAQCAAPLCKCKDAALCPHAQCCSALRAGRSAHTEPGDDFFGMMACTSGHAGYRKGKGRRGGG